MGFLVVWLITRSFVPILAGHSSGELLCMYELMSS